MDNLDPYIRFFITIFLIIQLLESVELSRAHNRLDELERKLKKYKEEGDPCERCGGSGKVRRTIK
jgi:hypothetical protein